MRGRVSDEGGFTLVELLVVMVIMAIVVGGLVSLIESGARADSDTQGRLEAQQTTRLAVDRFEYEVRCASSATILSSGAGVHLVLPAQCVHASGDISWCVSSGTMSRYSAATCTGTASSFARRITSPTPFSLLTASGYRPRLSLALTVTSTGRPGDSFSVTDVIALRNAAVAP